MFHGCPTLQQNHGSNRNTIQNNTVISGCCFNSRGPTNWDCWMIVSSECLLRLRLFRHGVPWEGRTPLCGRAHVLRPRDSDGLTCPSASGSVPLFSLFFTSGLKNKSSLWNGDLRPCGDPTEIGWRSYSYTQQGCHRFRTLCLAASVASWQQLTCSSADKFTGNWRKLHNEELHNLYSSLYNITVIGQGGFDGLAFNRH
jgi:hypothetical protein